MNINEKISSIEEIKIKFDSLNKVVDWTEFDDKIKNLSQNLKALKESTNLTEHIKTIIIKDSFDIINSIADAMQSNINQAFQSIDQIIDQNIDKDSTRRSRASYSTSWDSRSRWSRSW